MELKGAKEDAPHELEDLVRDLVKRCEKEARDLRCKVAYMFADEKGNVLSKGGTPGPGGLFFKGCKQKIAILRKDNSTKNLVKPSMLSALCCILPRWLCCGHQGRFARGALAIEFKSKAGDVKMLYGACSGDPDPDMDLAVIRNALSSVGDQLKTVTREDWDDGTLWALDTAQSVAA